MRTSDITGQRFGRLTVLGSAGRGENRKLRWLCVCDCGRETVVGSAYHLRSGNTKSCGCLRKDVAREMHYTHRGEGTRLYNIWNNARQRCGNPNNPDYYLYGARGVVVSKEWSSFGAFQEWAFSNGYRDDLTLDRIDPDGNYAPDNCRWATWLEQRHNQRRCKGVVL